MHLLNRKTILLIRTLNAPNILKYAFYIFSEIVDPIINGGNLNDSAIKLHRDSIQILQCYADGVPKPTITWYKVNY